ncbi:MAG: ImmA/IrrE family metallo-endopeptidase [Gemmatimonadota bacterium]
MNGHRFTGRRLGSTFEPEADAGILRRTTWGDRIPVDPVRIALDLGFEVRRTTLPQNVSAALIKKRGHDPVIVIEDRDSDNRKRFSVAHELGHYILNAGDEEIERIDYRDTLASEGAERDEIYANKFAAELLMPEDEVKGMWESGDPPWLMAQKFGVSAEALRYRLINLGLPTEAESAEPAEPAEPAGI